MVALQPNNYQPTNLEQVVYTRIHLFAAAW